MKSLEDFIEWARKVGHYRVIEAYERWLKTQEEPK